ncbi:hypothetical protein CALVIDRAFT_594176 [Calocera viscosa TUFC12733]|uniref:Cryptic loci regulator 2 N-terminal domain-containing protein n=1 Tax=Calocera viscosa (strain TUFC12733) TaxID=1330018 RepID=A0A167S0I6_CALVF|nr:hypothetical protein CALVIDRAFT_594176 [Calocera viscosa TUFC12733]
MSSSTSAPAFDPPSDDGLLRFPRSDGDPTERPKETKENAPPGTFNYYELVPRNNKLYKDWRNKVGGFLITRLLPVKGRPGIQYSIADFPEHYALYFKPRMSGKSTGDPYLYGSKYGKVYRSPAEFAYHACWLMTDPTLDRDNCECHYCSKTPQSELSERLGVNVDRYNDTTTKPRSQRAASGSREAGRETPFASPVHDPAEEAQSALRDNPPYRVGEMVWVQIRPPIRGNSDDRTIVCWPTIVLAVLPRPILRTAAGYDQPQPAVKLKLLGTTRAAQVEAFDVVPYHAYAVAANSLEGYMANSRHLNVFDNTSFDGLSDIQLFLDSDREKGPRPVTFDRAWPAFVKGLVMTWRLGDRWSLTRTVASVTGDGISPSIRSDSNTASAAASDTQNQISSDAIWWGAEQIWIGDLVRLRGNSIQNTLILPFVSRNAVNRCLLLRIASIQTRRPNRLADVWLSGTLYETVPEGEEDESSRDDHAKTESGPGVDGTSLSGLVALPSLPEPPLGFRFRSVLSATNIVFVPLASVAGRYYRHLFFSPVVSATRSTNAVEMQELMSLCGYAPGDIWPIKPPLKHQDRKELWDGLEVEVKRFLMPQWKSSNLSLKPEPRE